MKTQIVSLETIRANDVNPRTITEAKFDQLVDSILSFPKMLSIRPIAVDVAFIALGGNMRYRALTAISTMTTKEIRIRLESQSSFQKKTAPEQKILVDYWANWQKKPVVEVVSMDDLTPDEQKEFLIKDNVGFGEWNWDALANEWNESELHEWGLDVWQPEAEEEEEPKAKEKEKMKCPHCGEEI